MTSERKRDNEAGTGRNLWVSAVNSHRGYGRRTFPQIRDPWDAKKLIRGFLASPPPAPPAE